MLTTFPSGSVVFSKRPARVMKEIAIPLAYPRSQKVRFTGAFTAAERVASEALGVVAPTADEASAHATQGAGVQ